MNKVSYNSITKHNHQNAIRNGEIGVLGSGDSFEMKEVQFTIIVEYKGGIDDEYVLYFKAGDKKILVPGELYTKQLHEYVMEEIEERR